MAERFLSINCQTVEIVNKIRFQWGPQADLVGIVRLLALFVLSLPGGVGCGTVSQKNGNF
jgi:hypothetical protein